MIIVFFVFIFIAMILIVLAKAIHPDDKEAAENLAGLCTSPLVLVGVTAWIMSLFTDDDPAIIAGSLLIFMGIGAVIGMFVSAMADFPLLKHMWKWCLAMASLGYVVGIFVIPHMG